MDNTYFKSLFDNQNQILGEIKSDIKDVREDVGNLKVDLAVVKSDVANLKTEVTDLKLTLTNHINSDIHEKNKRKSLSMTPPWILILLVFFMGRMSISVFDQLDRIHQDSQKLESQEHTFAPPSSTLVVTKKSTNKKVDDMIVKKLLGE